MTALLAKRHKLLELHYADQITSDAFADEESRLSTQIEALRADQAASDADHARRDELADRFDQVAALLADTDLAQAWDLATPAERSVLVEELVEAVIVFPDHLEVQIAGAPRLNVTFAEVGLRDPGTRTSVSEGGLEPPRPCGH